MHARKMGNKVMWAVIIAASLAMMTAYGPLQPLLYHLTHKPLKWNPVSDKELDSPTILAALAAEGGQQPARMLDMDMAMSLYVSQGVPEAQPRLAAPRVRTPQTAQAQGTSHALQWDLRAGLGQPLTDRPRAPLGPMEQDGGVAASTLLQVERDTLEAGATTESASELLQALGMDSMGNRMIPAGRCRVDCHLDGGVCKCVQDAPDSCGSHACECKPDFFGLDCATEIRHDAASVEQLRRKWHSSAWHHLMDELENLQSSRCDEQRVHYGLIGAGAKGAGLASTLRFMTGYLSDAYVEQRGFQFAGRLNYAGTRTCKRLAAVGDVDCFLQPMSNCTAQRSVAFHRFKEPKVRNNRCMQSLIGSRCNNMSPFLKAAIPERYAARGNFWWRSAMLAYLVRLNHYTQVRLGLEGLKTQIGYQHPIIGVHVRHGDACHTTTRKGTCKGLASYLPRIREMAERYSTPRVSRATDDQHVVNDAQRSTEFTFVVAPADRAVLNSKEQIEYRRKLWDGSSDVGHSIALSALQDTLLLAEADYLIVHLRSNMSRMALELSAAQKQYLPPFISIDGPWCAHWRMCEDRYDRVR